ncbi:response regulator transcription factor [Mesobacillus selenatarsenatis]|uniref:Heme response regulator HssR n=1 Tax=Mesobacillus selenatarsenatis (strain DSM 18680 / JCM 14380 / FERM P-15431 / SF-1) TaxID=1321606 RepID=A0A0A8X618_MESS1|nr:response regulator transcription factor [Mesobacillus selenatarsenatis]GAM15363.1 two-component response regulator colocalized with HrtAB transporter [Mesobacillus selenatarsenatis SF-1]
MASILIVDDDPNILFLVKSQLQGAGHVVYQAQDGTGALKTLNETVIDLAVVDVMMPGMDGYELTKQIRELHDIPVIMLTAKGQIEDKEQGFLSGTDDYIVKPFDPKELIFRINALFRRYQKRSNMLITIGNVTINQQNFEVQVGDKTLILPLKEFELLSYMAAKPNQVFTRNQLIEEIWGLDFSGDERTLNVHVKRLRDRFSELTDDFAIKTIRGVGYLVEVQSK